MALVGAVDALIAPEEYASSLDSALFLSGTTILIGLAAAWVLQLRSASLHLLAGLMVFEIVFGLITIVATLAIPSELRVPTYWALCGAYLAGISLVIYRGYGARRSRARRAGAVAVAIGLTAVMTVVASLDGAFWMLSAQVRPLLGRESAASARETLTPALAQDQIWEAQPALMKAQQEALRPALSGRANVYAIAVAGSGTQALFSREAHEALRAAAARFGGDNRGGILLSNGAADLMRSPLATRGNIAAAAKAVGEVADAKRDVMFVYLASHGSPLAELSSELPGYQAVQTISADSTAAALREAGVARRVIVVSACYAGAWIPALADDNTIVITASAADRTSFGCDDSRRLTVFGEAFLGSLAAKDLSLHDAFEDAKRKIAAYEREQGETASLPQAFVGRNMTALWTGRDDAPKS